MTKSKTEHPQIPIARAAKHIIAPETQITANTTDKYTSMCNKPQLKICFSVCKS